MIWINENSTATAIGSLTHESLGRRSLPSQNFWYSTIYSTLADILEDICRNHRLRLSGEVNQAFYQRARCCLLFPSCSSISYLSCLQHYLPVLTYCSLPYLLISLSLVLIILLFSILNIIVSLFPLYSHVGGNHQSTTAVLASQHHLHLWKSTRLS